MAEKGIDVDSGITDQPPTPEDDSEGIEVSPKCESCDKTVNNTWHCEDCPAHLCNDCKISHMHNEDTKEHVLYPSESQHVSTEEDDDTPQEVSFSANTSIATILAVNPMEAWIASVGSQTITLYNDGGEIIRTAAFPFKVQGFAVLDNKDFIFSNYEGKSLHRMSRDGQVTKLAKTSPFCPTGIHVIRESQQFIVCLVGPCGGKLVRYSKNGTSRLQTIMKDKTSGLPLFRFPRRVVENANGDMGVVDLRLHCLTILSNDGDPKCTYKGSEQSRRMGKIFDPWDVCVDFDQNYLVSNTGNNTIDLLDKDGKFIKYILAIDDGIKFPLGLSFDSRSVFWVGNAYGRVILFEV